LAQKADHLITTKKKLDRSLLQGEAIELFRSAIRNPRTRDPYERRLLSFLKAIKMNPDSFVDLAKSKPQVAEKILFKYINEQVERSERIPFICESVLVTNEQSKLALTLFLWINLVPIRLNLISQENINNV
jgi:uncharacterized protein VirK/YbjX